MEGGKGGRRDCLYIYIYIYAHCFVLPFHPVIIAWSLGLEKVDSVVRCLCVITNHGETMGLIYNNASVYLPSRFLNNLCLSSTDATGSTRFLNADISCLVAVPWSDPFYKQTDRCVEILYLLVCCCRLARVV